MKHNAKNICEENKHEKKEHMKEYLKEDREIEIQQCVEENKKTMSWKVLK